jgi:hypothetical protein
LPKKRWKKICEELKVEELKVGKLKAQPPYPPFNQRGDGISESFQNYNLTKNFIA